MERSSNEHIFFQPPRRFSQGLGWPAALRAQPSCRTKKQTSGGCFAESVLSNPNIRPRIYWLGRTTTIWIEQAFPRPWTKSWRNHPKRSSKTLVVPLWLSRGLRRLWGNFKMSRSLRNKQMLKNQGMLKFLNVLYMEFLCSKRNANKERL